MCPLLSHRDIDPTQLYLMGITYKTLNRLCDFILYLYIDVELIWQFIGIDQFYLNPNGHWIDIFIVLKYEYSTIYQMKHGPNGKLLSLSQ